MSDCISRRMAIKVCEEIYNNKLLSADGNIGAQMCADKIFGLPSIEPERKVGKWIKDKSWSEGAGMRESYGHYWKCNQCNNIVKGDWSQCGDNFCSECGADMRGKPNE